MDDSRTASYVAQMIIAFACWIAAVIVMSVGMMFGPWIGVAMLLPVAYLCWQGQRAFIAACHWLRDEEPVA